VDPNALMTVVLIALVGAMLYFSSRSRKRQVAAQQAKLNSIEPGVKVMTIGGIFGVVTSLVGEDKIELEIAPGVYTTWLRTAVRDVIVDEVETDEEVETVDDDQLAEYEIDNNLSSDTVEVPGNRDEKKNRDLG
jgi:preprotein translocase subunit YajC